MERELYAENIVDHYKNPRNQGTIECADIHSREYNPLCGDELDIFIKLEDDVVKELKFQGNGCAISQASASMLFEYAEGKTVDEIKKISRQDVLEMLGIDIGVVRMKCAMLSLSAIQKGIMKKEAENVIKNK